MSVRNSTPPNFAADGGAQKNATAWNSVINKADQNLPVIATNSGVVRIQSLTNSAILTGTAGSPSGTLSLGADPTNFSSIVLTNTQVIMNKPVVFNDGASVPAGDTLTIPGTLNVPNILNAVAGLTVGLGSLDTYKNRNIHGYSDTGYVSVASAPQASGPIPNPVPCPVGLYAVNVTAPGDPNIGAQVSALCYWSGSAWTGSGVSTAFTSNSPNCAIYPVNGSAQLNLGGASVPVGAVNTITFRQLLAAPNL